MLTLNCELITELPLFRTYFQLYSLYLILNKHQNKIKSFCINKNNMINEIVCFTLEA